MGSGASRELRSRLQKASHIQRFSLLQDWFQNAKAEDISEHEMEILLKALGIEEERVENATSTKEASHGKDHPPPSQSEGPGESLVQDNATSSEARYDLKDPHAFARFLQEADIRLVRAGYLHELVRSKRHFPRRQEAESCSFLSDGKTESALVSHEELQDWAAGTRNAIICSISHAWETMQHPDPCRHQLQQVVKCAWSYEVVFEADVWFFYDYTSLYQFERFSAEEDRSFKAAMANMHAMYAHECTITFRIESLTPECIWEEMMRNDQELIPVWWKDSQKLEGKPLSSLKHNRVAYRQRGWCRGEISWSSLRTRNAQDQSIARSDSDEVQTDGLRFNGKVALTPERFAKEMEQSAFTHRDDAKIVIGLQRKIFEEKVAVCDSLILEGLPAPEIGALANALHFYKRLKTLKVVRFKCGKEEAEAFGEALAASKIERLELVEPQGQSGHFMGKAVAEALKRNQHLTSIECKDMFEKETAKAVARAVRRNNSIQNRLPFDAPICSEVLALSLEQNTLHSLVHEVETLNWQGDETVGDLGAKAVCKILLGPNALMCVDLRNSCISDDGAKAIANALQDNQTLIELDLSGNQITDVGTQALADALKINKKLKRLIADLESKAVREVEKTKKDRGEEFEFISVAGDEEAAMESENANIGDAVYDGELRVVRHLLRQDPSLLNENSRQRGTPLIMAARCPNVADALALTELLLEKKADVGAAVHVIGNTALHYAAAKGNLEVAQRLIAAGAPLNVKNDGRNTPLDFAKSNGHTAVVKILEDAGAQ